MVENGDIYKGQYSGWYCRSDEAFLTDAQITTVNGQRVSLENGNSVEWISEYNYVFRLSKYQQQIKQFLEENPSFVFLTFTSQ